MIRISKQVLLDGAELLDAYRVFPRAFMLLYFAGLAKILEWAILLKDVSTGQTAFISVVAGTIPFMLNFYMQTGRQWQKEKLYELDQLNIASNPAVVQVVGVPINTVGDSGAILSTGSLRP